MSVVTEIVEWQKSRGLVPNPPKKFNLHVETLNIIEELIESRYNIESSDARDIAMRLMDDIDGHLSWKNNTREVPWEKTTADMKVDAFCDIIVFATGAIAKLGYDPEKALQQTLLEINSRTGKLIDGKFVKDKSPEAMANWINADYRVAKID